MALLGDFGGFNDGVLFLPAILMAFYNSKMFYSDTATLLPIKHRHKARAGMTSTEERFASEDSLGANLIQDDVDNISSEAKVAQVKTNSWIKSLCCCFMICKRNRRLRM